MSSASPSEAASEPASLATVMDLVLVAQIVLVALAAFILGRIRVKLLQPPKPKPYKPANFAPTPVPRPLFEPAANPAMKANLTEKEESVAVPVFWRPHQEH